MSRRPEGDVVLRSVYLPEDLDGRLRSVAFLLGRSKGDLIREFVRDGLEPFEEAAAEAASEGQCADDPQDPERLIANAVRS